MSKPSIAPAVLVAMLAAGPAASASPSERDLRMAGQCAALGSAVIQNGDSFRDTAWRQAALALMLAPMVLADAGLEVPFKEHPTYRGALESTMAELASQPPSPASPAYRDRLKPCLDWAGEITARLEKDDQKK